ncbi:sensor histidine kinase [Enterococcus devriesei]|uniref:sensor histidine kinase n=1 Tax=Enterococcus devriesei TaxID=319970 RepID=UPI0036D3AB09
MISFFVFLKAYRDGYVVTSKLSFYITVQLIVACFFGVVLQNGTLFILTAWEIGSLPVNRGTFRNYLLIYYLSSAISLGVMLFSTSWESESIVIGSVITTIAAIGSPLAAKAVSESYRRFYRLDQQNKRLEAIIRQNERERIARDLHDNLGQAFSLITLKAELANKLLAIDSEKAKTELLDITETSRKNLSLVRKIVTNLQERTIAKTMLEEEKHLSVATIELLTEGEEIAEDWPIKTQDVLSAVIKEAVTNMIRHSRASIAKIQFTEENEEYHLLVQDNGQGFEEIKPGANGILGMEKRIHAANGIFLIKGTTGTQIYITLPKEKVID